MLPQRIRLGQCQLGESALVLLQTIHSVLNVSLLWSSLCKNNKFHIFQEIWINALTVYGAGSHCSTGELFLYVRGLDVSSCSLKLVLTEPGMLLGPS